MDRAVAAVADQRAFGHGGFADAAGDRGGHLGVRQVDARGFHGGLGGHHGGIRLLQRGDGVVVVLLTDVAGTQQWLVAVYRHARDGSAGLCFGQIAFCAVVAGLIGGRIDLVQGRPGLDIAAFNEIALQDDAADLRANFGDTIRSGTARKIGSDVERLGLQGHHAHFRSLLVGALLLGFFIVTSC